MNALVLIVIALPLFYLAYRFYARYIARLFEESDKNPTPAVEINDGVDFVPTKTPVVFGHHFASIAGAGPIIGPTVGLLFGYLPVWLWLVLGSIFVGAVHDFSGLFASIRERGKSMAEIAERSLGRWGFVLFIAFTVLMLLMVTSAFLNLTAVALTSLVPLKVIGLSEGQSLFKTKLIDGVVKAQIGGIASTSVIVITLFAPLLGYYLYKKRGNVVLASLFAVVVGIGSIRLGISHPVTIDPGTWILILSIYTIFAAGIPVWIILQPRDFTNSFLLYGGIIALLVGGLVAGLKGVTFSAPSLNLSMGPARIGPLWPMLFITVACGAISGFHALVAGGTTSKQLSREPDAKRIAYGGMLLEALLAIGVVVAVGCGIEFKEYLNIAFPTDPAVRANPVLAFSLGMGGLLYKGFSVPTVYGTVFGILLVEGFVITTLDTAIRLNRYLLEELWGVIFRIPPRIFRTYIFNSSICVGLMFLLAYYNAFLVIWPIFGSANQLLAALTLLAVTVWLASRAKRFWFILLPAIFMMVTTTYSLLYLLKSKYLPAGNWALTITDILLIVLLIGVVILSVRKFKESRVVSNRSPAG